jgi:predicted MFS family arabinose efflux permease
MVSANLFGLEWRPIFFVNVPIGIAAIIASVYLVRESKSERAQRTRRCGCPAFRRGAVCAHLSHCRRPRAGWPWWCFALLGSSFCWVLWFMAWEKSVARRGGSPLVTLDLFHNAAYARGLAAILLLFCGLSSFSFVMANFSSLASKCRPERPELSLALFRSRF